MARIPRMHRVVTTHLDGTEERRHYQTPEAAQARRERFEQADPKATVVVTASHPITYPHPAGDADPLQMPDTLIARSRWHDLAAHLGLAPEHIKTISIVGDEILVEYQPDPKRAPLPWRVEIIEEKP